MTQIDYTKIGFKAGIEIHAQLEGKKLFCDCKTIASESTQETIPPDFIVTRELKAVKGESGVVDVAAKSEQEKKKVYEYRGNFSSSCLIELDEEPPKQMNSGALHLALQMCKRLSVRLVDEIQVMRKTVVDGSNTSGFQRTALLGMNGHVVVSDTKVGIQTICLEEDACKLLSRDSNKDVYDLSRLGIPLIEIATDPDMKNPLEVQAVAKELGMLLRSLQPFDGQSIKRGLGTIRQDVNISIKGGNRVEIKGAQDLKQLPLLSEYEVLRQQALLLVKKQFPSYTFTPLIVDVSHIFEKTSCAFFKKTLSKNGSVLAIKVPLLKGVLGIETMPGRRIGSEISDYAKVASGVKGLIHSDEDLSKYTFSDLEVVSLQKELGVEKNDAFILVAEKKDIATVALMAAAKRISLLSKGVLKEVRKANQDATTSYLRPMSSGNRMYPETDTLPIIPDMSTISLGKTLDERIHEFELKGIPFDIAKHIANKYDDIFTELESYFSLDSLKLASLITQCSSVIEPDVDILKPIIEAMNAEIIPKNAFLEILTDVKNGVLVEKAINSRKSLPKKDVEKLVDEVLLEVGEIDDRKRGLIMGKVMAASKGKANGKVVSEIIQQRLLSKK